MQIFYHRKPALNTILFEILELTSVGEERQENKKCLPETELRI